MNSPALQRYIDPASEPLFDHYLRDVPGLTYESPDDGWIARKVTRGLERALGREKIEREYFALKDRKLSTPEFFREAQRVAGITLNCDYSPLDAIDKTKPVLFIANHPFGVMDGLILCNIALRIADDFRVVINSLLCQDRELARHFLPIDFSGTKEATKRNVRAKQLAGEGLEQNIPLVLFPSGMVSTAGKFGLGPVHDAPWTTFVAKLVGKYQPTVVPVYFHGRNSRPFHIASHIAEPLRMAMLMHEALRQFNRELSVVIGEPITADEYGAIAGRQALTDYLYGRVQGLA